MIFGRSIYRGRKNHTPGTFATRVVTNGVTPSLHVLYKHTQIKQYHKLGKALRTETTINQALDFGIGKRLTNLPALRQIGYTANRRLLAVQRLSHDPITGAEALASTCAPVTHDNGTRVAGLRLTDPRAQALLHILLIFRLHPGGFPSKDLRALLGEYLGRPPHGPGSITPGQATYDLRRLREHGLIQRIPRTHRYQVTPAACATPCSSPASTTGSCEPGSPNSPALTRRLCAKPPLSTRPPSTTSPSEQE